MKITREQLKGIVGEVLQEEQDYQQYFQAMLKKHGVKSPAQFKTDAEKKAFFDKVEAGWKGVSERIAQVRKENAEKVQQLREQEAQLKQEMETKKAELEELNNRITQAVETLEKLRPTQALSETEQELAKLNGEAVQTEEPQQIVKEGLDGNQTKNLKTIVGQMYKIINDAPMGEYNPNNPKIKKAIVDLEKFGAQLKSQNKTSDARVIAGYAKDIKAAKDFDTIDDEIAALNREYSLRAF